MADGRSLFALRRHHPRVEDDPSDRARGGNSGSGRACRAAQSSTLSSLLDVRPEMSLVTVTPDIQSLPCLDFQNFVQVSESQQRAHT